MKRIQLTLLSMLAFAAVTVAQNETKDQQLVVPLSEPGKAYKLNVSLLNGSIKVVGYEGKDIMIDVKQGSERVRKNKNKEDGFDVNVNINSKHDRGEQSNGMKRINAVTGLDVSARENNNTVTVQSDSWKGAVTLTIKVPSNNGTLKLHSTNDGDISVTNVSGELEITNTNGSIFLTSIAGSAVANTVNGAVTASFKSVDPKAAMAFSTLNGNVDVTFPSTFKANVKLKSDMGEMFTDFDMEADKNQPKVNRTSQSGMYRVNIENWVYGKINGGGPELMMKNMNGNIYIRKAK
jgi:hypothetical protein